MLNLLSCLANKKTISGIRPPGFALVWIGHVEQGTTAKASRSGKKSSHSVAASPSRTPNAFGTTARGRNDGYTRECYSPQCIGSSGPYGASTLAASSTT